MEVATSTASLVVATRGNHFYPRSSQIGEAFRGFVAQALLPVHLTTHGPQAPSPATGRFGFQITQSSDHRITRSLPPPPPIPHLGFKKTYAIQPRGYPIQPREDTPKSASSVLISGKTCPFRSPDAPITGSHDLCHPAPPASSQCIPDWRGFVPSRPPSPIRAHPRPSAVSPSVPPCPLW